MAGFGSALARMDAAIMAVLNDGSACYTDRNGVAYPPLSIIIDFNVEITGPEGMYSTAQVGITFNATDLAEAVRGGMFVYDRRRFVVEDEIANDGHVITVACMEQI